MTAIGQSVERADGPLRSDYAGYGTDIAAAARHLLSVLTSMQNETAQVQHSIDLAGLAGEAVVMIDSSAEERSVRIDLERSAPLPAKGERKTGSARPPASAMRQREEKSSGGGAFAAALAKAQERRKGA